MHVFESCIRKMEKRSRRPRRPYSPELFQRKKDRTADQCEAAHKRERKNFTPEQKTILNGFVEEHYKICYPSIKEKKDLAEKTNLTLSQVSDYFINARRRYLPKYILNNKSRQEAETTSKRRTKSVPGSPSASKKLKPSPTDSSPAEGGSTSGTSSSSSSQDAVDDTGSDCPIRDGSGSGDYVFSLDSGTSCGDNEEPGSDLSSRASSPSSTISPSPSPASSPYREETSSDEERPPPARPERELDAAFGLLKFADLSAAHV